MGCPLAGLNKYSITCICFPEFFWYAELLPLENAVKVRYIIESAFVGYLGYGVGGIDQQPRRMAQAYFVKAIDECFTGALFYEPAERRLGHIGYARHLSQGDRLVVIGVHKLKYLFDAAAGIVELFVAKTKIGQ